MKLTEEEFRNLIKDPEDYWQTVSKYGSIENYVLQLDGKCYLFAFEATNDGWDIPDEIEGREVTAKSVAKIEWVRV